jgi:hypothetical protein
MTGRGRNTTESKSATGIVATNTAAPSGGCTSGQDGGSTTSGGWMAENVNGGIKEEPGDCNGAELD